MRPRFRVLLEIEVDDARDLIAAPLSDSCSPVEGLVAGYHMELKIPRHERHFWSPHLSLEVEPSEGVTLLRGLFGPRPSVWTMFATYYMALAFIAFIGFVLGLSQWTLDKTAWGLWALPFSGIAFVAGYSAALFGQKLGSDQMDTLREYLRACLEGVAVRPEVEAARDSSSESTRSAPD